MEFLSSTISIGPQVSSAISFVTLKSRINHSTLTIPNSKRFSLRQSFSVHIFRPIPSRMFQISAHFGRASGRQNYLRKKLTQQHQPQQVSENLAHEFDKVVAIKSNLDTFSDVNDESLDNFSEDSKNVHDNYSRNEGGRESEEGLGTKKIGESIMWNKLESWVEQYKQDSQFWGIGTGPIFTVFQDAQGKVERVVVNEDEIMRRSRIDPRLDNETEVLDEVDFKMSFAKDMAKEMENGINVIPKNSSVAKFIQSGAEESRTMEAVGSVTVKPLSFPSMSKVGVLVLCGLSVIGAIKGLLIFCKSSTEEYTTFEKEMLRRKIKARKEEEKTVKGSVEVIQDLVEPKGVSFKRPQLDKDILVNMITVNGNAGVEPATPENELQGKIEEIRAMARHARETERRESLQKSLSNDETSEDEISSEDSDETRENMSVTDTNDDIGQLINGASEEKGQPQFLNIPNGTKSLRTEVSNEIEVPAASENLHSADGPGCKSRKNGSSSGKKLRIIKSAKEAREYLSRKHQRKEAVEKDDHEDKGHSDNSSLAPNANVASGITSQITDLTENVPDIPPQIGVDGFLCQSEDCSMGSKTAEGDVVDVVSLNGSETSRISSGLEIPKVMETDIWTRGDSEKVASSIVGGRQNSKSAEVDAVGKPETESVPTQLGNHRSEDTAEDETPMDLQDSAFATDNEVKDMNQELAPSVSKENWMEKNFHEFEPIMEKIGAGFRDSYQLAKEKASQDLGSEIKLAELKSDDAESELEWMKDERLREIVFKVRDNELSGRDPFHLMDEDDKLAFFNGLEKKVEQENTKLLKLHEYLHSNIENLDYGADGISMYDPPEKIIPRWKNPPAERNPEFLNNFVEQKKEFVAESLKNSFLSMKSAKEAVDKSEKLSSLDNDAVAADGSGPKTELQKDNLASPRTKIEGSDGSVKAGKRSGKEFWQHTKKYSEGFLQSYNAESDPEAKAAMRDIGKDLDRWITEKELKEAAELMEKLPEKAFIKQKLNKVRREMELYGPQAVVSKYREYAEEKEEDYLWWLDLPYVLCIELYTVEDGEEKVGFYSLEMAADLELDPKPYHVIAFEEAGDCRNLCYIIQSKMEILGNGNAFIVARPPKDAFREAKANGFNVTVIRKGELQLNVDQTLEEAEELIAEIGSKIYHDSITKERSVDVNGLMKGVFGITKPTKRKRSKRKLKRRIKP